MANICGLMSSTNASECKIGTMNSINPIATTTIGYLYLCCEDMVKGKKLCIVFYFV